MLFRARCVSLNSKKRFILSHGLFFREEAKKPSDGRRNAPDAYGVMSVL